MFLSLAGPTRGILANSATEETRRPMVAEPAKVPPRCPRPYRTDAGNFGKFRYGKNRPPNGSGTCQCSSRWQDRRGEFWQIPLRKKRAAEIVAEPAKVPPRCLRPRRTDAGNFGKFRYGKNRPPNGSGTCQCSSRWQDRRGEFWQIPLPVVGCS
jgi:hypothetical protein